MLPPMANEGMDQKVMPPLTLILIISVAPVALSMLRLSDD
jgi:hypothetical protein